MNIFNKIGAFGLIILIAFLAACLEDIVPPPLTGELDNTAKLLIYFEENGDYANSDEAPPLVSALELYNDIGNYLVIDTRNSSLFEQGHIENSVNVSNVNLYDFIENFYDSANTKIILVSTNGQSSAYYSSLLRLAGFNNIYSLKYGMASWHIDFANEWLNIIHGDSLINPLMYTNQDFPKNDFTDLPYLDDLNPNTDIEGYIKSRIKMLITAGFNLNNTYVTTIPLNDPEIYIACYGNVNLYFGPKGDELGHPVNTASYLDSPTFEFRSSKYLQTLPANRTIIVYSYNGQLSASIVAYLNVLGYTAKTLKFGANHIFYARMLSSLGLVAYAFTENEIMNFDYVSGID